MSRQRQWTGVLASIATAAFAVTLVAKLRPHTRPLEPSDRAPAFQAQRLDGKPAALADYAGKVVLLNIWATWCVPCRAEMPSMERLQREFANGDFHVVAVSVDEGGPEVVAAFARDLGLSFEVLHDPVGEIQRTYRTSGVPESWVIDRRGVIVKKVIGATQWDSPVNTALVGALLDAR